MAATLPDVERVVRVMAETVVANEKYFGDLDAVVGDGDFGYSMARGFEIVLSDWDGFDRTDISTFLKKVAVVITSRIGGTSGLGLKLAAVGNVSGAQTKGVVITAIDPNGSAAARGIETGDVILTVSGQAVSTPVEVQNALSKARGEDKKFVLVQLMSGETTRFVAVPADPM